jgi:hypothetical protein
MATYERDRIAEFGPELDEQGAVFRRQYHLDPYLSSTSELEIRERLTAIGDNLVRYDQRGSPRLLNENESLLYWRKKLEEILEEIRGRGGNLFEDSRNLPGTKVLRISHDIRQKREYETYTPWGRVPQRSEWMGQSLFKFGKREHLCAAFAEVRIRVNLA